MLIAGGILWAVVFGLMIYSRNRSGRINLQAFRIVGRNGRIFVAVVPTALIAANFLTPLLPGDLVGRWLGDSAGLIGILIGTLAGWCLPVPPMIVFPLVAALLNAGAGIPQLTALVAAWNVFGFHRTLPLEVPVMGGYFVSLRLISSVLMPPAAGLIAMFLMGMF